MDRTRGSANVAIALVDGPVALDHPDLSEARPDAVVLAPTQVLPTKNKQGDVFIDAPHGLCVRGDVACVHRGLLPGVPSAPTGNLAAWVVLTFFRTAGLAPVKLLTRDGLERWVRDAPKPVVTICTTCGGAGIDPNGKADEDGVREACPTCHGDPHVVNEDAAAVEVGPVKVVLADLLPFLPHLSGANVGLGVAPRVGGRPGELDLHVRHVTDERGSTGGEWRVQMLTI